MFNYTCLNPIAQVGLDELSDQYQKVEDINDADAVLVRSAAMHDMEFSDKLCAIARAGAGVNNIPLDKCADQGIVVFNKPGVVCFLLPEILQVVWNGLKKMLPMKILVRQWRKRKSSLPEPN